MIRPPAFRLAAAALTLAIVAMLAPSASAVVVQRGNGTLLSLQLRPGARPTLPRAAARAPSSRASSGDPGALSYHGGPVLPSSTPYLIFWAPAGETIAGSSRALFTRYFADVAADSGTAANVYAVNRQFTDASGFADYRQSFNPATQVVADSQPYPARDVLNCPAVGASYPTCLTDSQLQSEISRVIGAQSLPTGTGAGAPIYFVVTPADVNVCADTTDCSSNVFCAYHSSVTRAGGTVLYAAVPMFFNGASAAQDPKACQADQIAGVQQPNGDAADVALGFMSHEDNETITDPLGTAWYNDGSGNENGDNCIATGAFDPAKGTNPGAFTPTLGGTAGPGPPSPGTLYDQVINGHPYYLQSEWSNGDGTCSLRPPPATLAPSFTAPTSAPPGTAVSFAPAASTGSFPFTSATWDFGDGTGTFTAGSSLATVTHTYAQRGAFTVALTVVDDRGNLASATRQVTVAAPPSAAFTVPAPAQELRPLSFDGSASSDPAGTIVSYAWTYGDGSSGTGAKPGHTYAHAGSYTVTLTVTSSTGLTNGVSHQINVADEVPTGGFTVRTARGAGSGAVRLGLDGGRSADPDGRILTYLWDFGDGSRRVGSPASRVSHLYRRLGRHLVKLTVTDSSGGTGSVATVLPVGGRIVRISLRPRRPGATLLVTVDEPGALLIGHRRMRATRGSNRFRISLSATQRRRLARGHPVVLRIRVSFAPLAGPPSARTVTVTIRR